MYDANSGDEEEIGITFFQIILEDSWNFLARYCHFDLNLGLLISKLKKVV